MADWRESRKIQGARTGSSGEACGGGIGAAGGGSLGVGTADRGADGYLSGGASGVPVLNPGDADVRGSDDSGVVDALRRGE